MMKCFQAGKGLMERAIPSISSATDVLIKVKAFGINGPDLLQNKGLYPPPPGVTDVLGLELSGTIVDAKDNSLIGKEVCALVPGGAYAEYCIADYNLCLPLPVTAHSQPSATGAEEDLSGTRFVQAAGIIENLFTVWKNLFRHKELIGKVTEDGPGRSMLFHGGSGGIGLTAVTLAKFYGVDNVIVTAGSEEKCRKCLDLGADHAINYRNTDLPWEKAVKEIGKVDVILDIVGGEYLQKNLNLLNAKGRLIILGFLGKTGPVAKDINLGLLLMKGLTITGSVLRSNPIEQKIQLKQEIEREIWPKIRSGELKLPAHISHVFKGLDNTEKALEMVTDSQHFGKVIVQV